nr:MAG TPA: hypothetical protein [Caudoviricetes sp.]
MQSGCKSFIDSSQDMNSVPHIIPDTNSTACKFNEVTI